MSGYTQTVSYYGPSTIVGYTNIGGNGAGEPGHYAGPTYLQSLIGAFATSAGVVVGSPFAVSESAVYAAPLGATELLLGINDNHYGDNLGSLTVAVTGSPAVSAVPLPAAAPMFGAAVVGLGMLGMGLKRRRSATA